MIRDHQGLLVFTPRLYLIIFALSGFCGLIYEAIWSHYLKLFLGHAAYAQTLVLVIFMGGMAIGAGLASYYGQKIRNLLLGYAIVEGIIGVFAIGFHALFITLTDFAYAQLLPYLPNAFTIQLFKWSLAALLILPQCILLGMTFPLMGAGFIRRFPATPGYSLAILYFVNSFGGAMGILISGFMLMNWVGLPGTVLTAGLLNILLALLVWLLSRHTLTPPETSPSPQQQPRMNPLFIAWLLCAAFTGMASFLYEIAWIRMLSLVLGSSTHAFELMLSAFILGLALGGYWIRRRVEQFSDPVKTLGLIQIAMGLLALATLWFYGHTFYLMHDIIAALALTAQGYVLFNFFSHGLAMLVMLPATFCAGMTLPLLTYYLLAKQKYGESAIGAVYAANTVGAIVGVIIGIQVIMPVLGLKHVITLGGGIDIALGMILLWYARQSKVQWQLTTLTAMLIFLATLFLLKLDPVKMASGVFRHGQLPQDRTILFHQDGKTASVDLIQEGSLVTISTNGKPDASINKGHKTSPDELTGVLCAALPLALHNRVTTVANIGMGSALTTHTLLADPNIETVDTVEIEAAMIKAAQGFGDSVVRTFTDPRSHIHIEDAKTYFTSQQKSYDLIISEPSNPWVSGVAGLFSQEFYQLIGRYLHEEGLFVQWLQLYELDIQLVASVIKALSPQFADYVIYYTRETDILIIAQKNGTIAQPSNAIFAVDELAETLARLGILNQQDLLLRKIGSKRSLDPLFFSYPMPAHSDYFPILDLQAVRSRFLRKDVRELLELKTTPLPVIEALEGRSPASQPLAIHNNEHFQLGERAQQAMLIYHYFQSGAMTHIPTAPAMNSDTIAAVRAVRSLHYQSCQFPETKRAHFGEMMEKGWLPYLHFLAAATIPYLSPQELAVIWHDIETAPCFATLPQSIHQWFKLYQAVSQRAFNQAAQHAEQQLPQGIIAATESNNYLLATALLGHLLNQRYSAALALWQRYADNQNPPIVLRLLGTLTLTYVQ